MKLYAVLIFVYFLNSQNLLDNWELIDYFPVEINKDKYLDYHNNELYQLIKHNESIIIVKSNNDTVIKHDEKFKWPLAIDVTNEIIAVNSFSELLIFKKNGNKYHLENSTELDYSYNNLVVKNENIYLFDVYVSDDNCEAPTQTIFTKIDLEDFTQKTHYFENPNGVELSNYIPRQNIDIYDDIIVISNISKYEINFYDIDNFKIITKITRNPEAWTPLSEKLPPLDCEDYSTFFDKLDKFLFRGSYIWRSEFINDSTFLVTWSYPIENRFDVKYDLFIKNGNKWDYIKTYDDYAKNKNDLFTGKTIKTHTSITVSDNILISTEKYPYSKIKLNKFNVGEMNRIFQDYYFENELEFTTFIYRYNLK